MAEPPVLDNPYVGPRAIEKGEAFHGREKEIHSLASLLSAERIVLLHSPSGAGKSSLIKAGLVPLLAKRFNIFRLVRVNLELPEEVRGVEGLNRYTLSTLLSLEEGLPTEQRLPLSTLAELTLDAYLEQCKLPDPVSQNSLLIFDQFEEILTISPTDAPAKQAFFEQLGEALQDRHRWALFAIREDYIGGLDPYVRDIPNRLRVTFRLSLLGVEAARLAIQQPASAKNVEFTNEAAQKLVDDLRHIQVQKLDGSFTTEAGPSIEPVQLQVVCYNLWQSGAAADKIIDADDLKRIGNVDQALANFYANAIQKVGDTSGIDERVLRQWFDENLITAEGIRSQVLRGTAGTKGLPYSVLDLLVGTYLIRAETRADKTWYELSHDRLVKPIQDDNAAWFEKNLTLLQRRSVLWNRQGLVKALLLRGHELEAAEKEARERQPSAVEQVFLNESLKVRDRERRDVLQRRLILAAFITSLILAVVVLVGLFNKANQAATYANKAATEAVVAARLAATMVAKSTQTAISFNRTQVAATQAVILDKANQAGTAEATAVEGANVAATSQANAEIMLNQAQIAAGYRANSLADTSRLLRRDGKLTLSTLLAIEAFKIVDNSQTRSNLLEILGNTIQIINTNPNEKAINPANSDLMPNTISFNPDGSRLAAGYNDGTIEIWNSDPLRFYSLLGRGSTPPVDGVVYSPDGKQVYKTEYNSKSISIWDALKADSVPNPVQPPKKTDHTNDILCLAISPDGKILATGSQDETIRLWDTSSMDRIGEPLSPKAGWVRSLAFSPDGKLLATAHGDGSIWLWDVNAGKPLSPALTGHGEDINKVLFSPDGKLLASGGQDKWVILWDVQKHSRLGSPLTGHLGAVNSLAFSPDGKLLVSGSNDGSLILWDVEKPQMIGQIFTSSLNRVNNVAFHPEGKIIASGSVDGSISLWQLSGPEWIKSACRLVSRNLKPNEWVQYFPGEVYRNTCEK